VVLDAGVFIAIERRDKTVVRLVQRFVDAETPLVTSAGVVAQVWRGGGGPQFPAAYLLRRTTVADLTHSVARLIGRMLGTAGGSDAIDGHLVLLARQRGWVVLSADADDLLAIDPTVVVERL
jgi:hypothetical protein